VSKLKVNLPTIRKGSKGKAVRILQALLYINVTGEFDQATEDSCKYFQNKSKISVDGICGPKTWGKVLEDL
jgi:peptidoglycan hydrolase-like protein with peptidoglycan-binding domain